MNEKTRQKTTITKEIVANIEAGKIKEALDIAKIDNKLFEIKNSAHLKEKFINNIVSDITAGKEVIALVNANIQKEEMNLKIREKLQDSNIISKHNIEKDILVAISNSSLDKKQIENYTKGNILKPHEAIGSLKPGSELKIIEIDKEAKKVTIETESKHYKQIDLKDLQKTTQYEVRKIKLSEGETIIFNKNTKELKNGTTAKITKIENGRLTLNVEGKEILLDKKNKHFEYGYAMTTHKSQGMDGKHVHALLSGMSSKNAIYVASTRAVMSFTAYTSNLDKDSEKLKDNQKKLNIADVKSSAKSNNIETLEKHVSAFISENKSNTKSDLAAALNEIKPNKNLFYEKNNKLLDALSSLPEKSERLEGSLLKSTDFSSSLVAQLKKSIEELAATKTREYSSDRSINNTNISINTAEKSSKQSLNNALM